MMQTSSQNLLRNVVFNSKEKNYGLSYDVQFSMCNHTFEWKIDQYIEGKTGDTGSCEGKLTDSYDVMPVLPSFLDIDYDPYTACHKVMMLLTSSSLSSSPYFSDGASGDVLNDIVQVLIESLVSHQREKVKLLTKSFRYTLYKLSFTHITVIVVICS
jgi:hypothetical protein